MTILQNKQKDYILEVKSLNENDPSCLRYQRDLAGYLLCTAKNQWVFPFKKTRIKLNIESILLPDNTVGIINNIYFSTSCFEVINNVVTSITDFSYIDIRSRKLFPFKIKKGTNIAMLYIIPTIECYIVKD